jgi:uncharacterized protein (DUF58 family)
MAELRDFLDPREVAQLGKLQVVAQRIVEGFLRGIHRSAAKGSSLEYAENRPYVPGDDLRHLDWRSYAKTDRFYLKQFEDETNLRATIALDASRSMSFGSTAVTKLRYASCLAAAIGYLLLEQRDAIGLAVIDTELRGFVPPRATAENLSRIFDTMEGLDPSGKTDFGSVLPRLAERVTPRSLVVLISDFLDDPAQILSGISQLRQRGCGVIALHLMDPAEIELPFDSWMVFRDLEDSSTEMRLDARDMREIYLENLAEHRETLRRGCAAAGVDYLFLDVREPFEVTLGRFLHLRSRRRSS